MIVCVFVATRRSFAFAQKRIANFHASWPQGQLFHSFLLPRFPSLFLFAYVPLKSFAVDGIVTRFASFRISNLILRRERERKAPHDTTPYSFSSLSISIYLSFALALSFSSVSVSLPFSLQSLSLYLPPFLFSLSHLFFVLFFMFCGLLLNRFIAVSVTRESKAEVQLIVVIALNYFSCCLCS